MSVHGFRLFASVHQIKTGILDGLLRLKQVTGILHISGAKRFLLRLAARDNQQLRSFITRTLIPLGITDVESHIVMDVTARCSTGAVVDE